MMTNYPLISCICITNNRPELLEKSILYFVSQNYPNKELVISYPGQDKRSAEVINDILKKRDVTILKIERNDNESLGEARNLAIMKCHGEYICTWDDDDWFHSSRLSFQYNSMQTEGRGYKASILTKILLYNALSGQAYASFDYTWDGSILCKKEIIFQNQYGLSNQGEDTHIIKFLDAKKLLYHIDNYPFLYIYVYHGDNTWNYEHFKYFTDRSQLLDEKVTQDIRQLLM